MSAPRRTPTRPPRPGDTGAYNSFWLENGSFLNRTSLIVDPPDGRLPPLTPEAKRREDALEASRKEAPGTWEDLNLFERCLTRGMPGAMMPGFYNHNYEIFQTASYVAFAVEMSGFRIVPLDGRPHISAGIRQWLGDSRARWEGDTLVVETTNLTDRVHERRRSNTVFGGSGQTTLVERFTRVDADTIDYRFTVTDPASLHAGVDGSHPDAEDSGAGVRVCVPRRQLRASERPARRPRARERDRAVTAATV